LSRGFRKALALSLATILFIETDEFLLGNSMSAAFSQTTGVENEINGLMNYDRKIFNLDSARLKK
jgi:hypothetical protein